MQLCKVPNNQNVNAYTVYINASSIRGPNSHNLNKTKEISPWAVQPSLISIFILHFFSRELMTVSQRRTSFTADKFSEDKDIVVFF